MITDKMNPNNEEKQENDNIDECENTLETTSKEKIVDYLRDYEGIPGTFYEVLRKHFIKKYKMSGNTAKDLCDKINIIHLKTNCCMDPNSPRIETVNAYIITDQMSLVDGFKDVVDSLVVYKDLQELRGKWLFHNKMYDTGVWRRSTPSDRGLITGLVSIDRIYW